jgi:predicted nucleic acid-binding protein
MTYTTASLAVRAATIVLLARREHADCIVTGDKDLLD